MPISDPQYGHGCINSDISEHAAVVYEQLYQGELYSDVQLLTVHQAITKGNVPTYTSAIGERLKSLATGVTKTFADCTWLPR